MNDENNALKNEWKLKKKDDRKKKQAQTQQSFQASSLHLG